VIDVFNILVVEDDRSTRKLITTILESNGFNVFAVEDGYSAVELEWKRKQEPIFVDRFYKGDESRSSEGTGLELSPVKRIMDLSKGKITVKSLLEEGALFTIELQKW